MERVPGAGAKVKGAAVTVTVLGTDVVTVGIRVDGEALGESVGIRPNVGATLGCRVGLPAVNVGEADGPKVGCPATYVGAVVGVGVGLPTTYVGDAVGSGVG